MSAPVKSEQTIELRKSEAAGEETSADAASKAKPRRGPTRRTLLASGLALLVAGAGAVWILAAPSSESTDDAYIAADSTSVAPKVSGLVATLLVRDNQAVRAGEPLVQIDSEEFDAKARGAEADLANADADVAAGQAALINLNAEERLAAANVAAARTSIRSSDAEASRAEADRSRYEALVATGAVSKRDADLYSAGAINAHQAAARAQATLEVSEREGEVTSGKRATLEAALQKAKAQQLRAAATLDLARQDQRHALISAPTEGVVGNRQVQVGDYVQPGTKLLTLVPLHALYVTANFKETQTRHMRVGQTASIKVDALGQALHGHVDSFAPGSGSTFSLLPFEPGTGNFTKIVQRVAVRIRFDPDQSTAESLRPGLSVTARVRLAD